MGSFDAAASRYGLKCQWADNVVLTKLEVRSGLETIPIIDGYLIAG